MCYRLESKLDMLCFQPLWIKFGFTRVSQQYYCTIIFIKSKICPWTVARHAPPQHAIFCFVYTLPSCLFNLCRCHGNGDTKQIFKRQWCCHPLRSKVKGESGLDRNAPCRLSMREYAEEVYVECPGCSLETPTLLKFRLTEEILPVLHPPQHAVEIRPPL